MKAFTAMMRVLIALTSLALTLMLVLSILPIATGQLAVEQGDPITATADGVNIDVTGSLKVTSHLKEDVKDVHVYIYAESGDGVKLTILDEKHTIKAGEVCLFGFDVHISLPQIMVFLIAENNGGTGMYLPLKIGVSGLYFHDMLGFTFDMDYSVKVSESASIAIDEPVRNSAGEVKELSATVSGLTEGDQIKSIVDSIIPPGSEPLEYSIGTAGITDVSLEVSNSADGELKVTVTTGSETAIKQAMEDVLTKSQNGETVVIDNGSGTTIELTPENVQDIYDTFTKYVDMSALEAIA